MRVAITADEPCSLLDALVEHLADHFLRLPNEQLDWPNAGRWVAEQVAQGEADRGVVICWTGTGVSIAANKVPGVRAALCTDVETAIGARRWNAANVLALGARLTTPAVGVEIVDAFLATPADPDEVQLVDRVEERP